MANNHVKNYEIDWNKRFNSIDKLAKERNVTINGKAWRKLRNYHFRKYVDKLQKPFGFLASMYYHTNYKNKIKDLEYVFRKHLRLRSETFKMRDRGETLAQTFKKFR